MFYKLDLYCSQMIRSVPCLSDRDDIIAQVDFNLS